MKLAFWRRKPKQVWPTEHCPGSGSSVEDHATFGGRMVRCPECGQWVPYGTVWGVPITEHDRSTDPEAIDAWARQCAQENWLAAELIRWRDWAVAHSLPISMPGPDQRWLASDAIWGEPVTTIDPETWRNAWVEWSQSLPPGAGALEFSWDPDGSIEAAKQRWAALKRAMEDGDR